MNDKENAKLIEGMHTHNFEKWTTKTEIRNGCDRKCKRTPDNNMNPRREARGKRGWNA